MNAVATGAIRDAIAGRESLVLDSLGIPWRNGRPHIDCPYSHHGGARDWRWDARKGRAYCTCIDGSDSALDVIMKVEGIDFETAKIRAAELIDRTDLIRNGNGHFRATDAASLLNAPADRRDDTLPIAYLAHRLGVPVDAVPIPSTPIVGLKSLGYYDPPPAGSHEKPKLVGEFPCAVFGTVGADARLHAHRVYLAPGGAGKAALGTGPDGRPRDPKKSARIIGNDNTNGRAILWGDAGRAPWIILSEGAETAAAIAFAFRLEIAAGRAAVAAGISASGIEAFRAYPATRRVTIAPDRDEAPKPNGKPASHRGEQAALEFGRRHHQALEVAIALPGKPGESIDWLDVLRRDGVDAVRTGILLASPFARATAGGRRSNGTPEPPDQDATDVPPPETNYPDPLADEAYHGIAGELVRAIEPHTEADPAGILIQFLVCAGSAIGRGPHCWVEATRHHLNLFAVLVGETSKARKGTSLGWAKRATIAADPGWEGCNLSGLASGEGLIHAVRDARFGTDKKGEQTVEDEGVTDKRLLVVEEEFARVLQVSGRAGNTLPSVLRDCWDGKRILSAASKNWPSRATGAHISIIGHITVGELLDRLTETDATSGLGNRFLWCFVRRSKLLPFGGDAPELDGITKRLGQILDAARTEHALAFDRDAARVWREIYPELTKERGGLLGAMLARGEAHVRRLAMLYAVLDGDRSIRVSHLQAALAVWEYSEASARHVFGADLDNTTADRILGALRCVEGPLSQTELHNIFCRHISGTRLLNVLTDLQRRKLVRAESMPSGGRPRTLWEAVT